MNTEEELAEIVRESLHELYPVTDGNVSIVSEQRGTRLRRVAGSGIVALAVTASVVGVAVLASRPEQQQLHSAGPAAASVTRAPSPTPIAVPAWAQKCVPRGVQADQFEGLSIGAGQARAKAQDTTLMIVGLDGRCLPLIAKILYHPMLVAVEHDRVVAARYQGWPGPSK